MNSFLFPEIIPITEQEVNDWLDKIPNLSSAPYRREAYRKAYRVDDKIRAAKASKMKPQNSP